VVHSRASRWRWRRPLALTATVLFGTLVGLVIAEVALQLGALYIGATEHAAAAAWRSDRGG
jgi:hypothetical protein